VRVVSCHGNSSRVCQDAAKGDVKMDVEGGEGGAVALPNQALIASGAETLLARTLLVVPPPNQRCVMRHDHLTRARVFQVQDALFDALSSSGLRDRYGLSPPPPH
jgi:hypothetical protein